MKTTGTTKLDLSVKPAGTASRVFKTPGMHFTKT